MVVTVDRFQAVCYPMVTFLKKRALWNAAICASWGIILVLSLPEVVIFSRTKLAPGDFKCWAQFIQPWGSKACVTWIFVAIFFIPTLVLTVCQVKICKVIKVNIYLKKHTELKMRDQKRGLPSRASSINCISKAMIKTVKMPIVTVVTYMLCWAPFFIVQLWTVWHPINVTKGAVLTIFMLLGNLNSCTNPWICMYFCGHLPYCVRLPKHFSTQEESAITASINLGDCEHDNVTAV